MNACVKTALGMLHPVTSRPVLVDVVRMAYDWLCASITSGFDLALAVIVGGLDIYFGLQYSEHRHFKHRLGCSLCIISATGLVELGYMAAIGCFSFLDSEKRGLPTSALYEHRGI